MSSPVNTDLTIKLLRDLPELKSNRCSGNIYPDVTDRCHTATQNIIDPSVSLSPGQPLLSVSSSSWHILEAVVLVLQACSSLLQLEYMFLGTRKTFLPCFSMENLVVLYLSLWYMVSINFSLSNWCWMQILTLLILKTTTDQNVKEVIWLHSPSFM